MKLAIVTETAEQEKRVAASPETVKKLMALGFTVSVEKNAGLASAWPDSEYEAAGATLCANAAEALKDADVLFKVQAPTESEMAALKKGAIVIGMFNPYRNAPLLNALAGHGLDSFSLELVPRTTRAQAMDVLSSQANLAGYRAVLDAGAEYGRAFPMMMTAAGTVPPAKVLVMGAGVAGLQAIATARRLGAIVSATDVRPAAKGDVLSLGASFVAVEDEEFQNAQTAGGYAKPMSPEYQAKQAALIAETIKKMDIVITTALIPGRAAPVLVSEDMVKTMKPGAVIVDLAVEAGGNCPISEAGKVVVKHGVTLVGHLNMASRLAPAASALYARNLLNFVTLLVNSETKSLHINLEDDILKGSLVTHQGEVVHPNFVEAAAKAKAA